MATTNIQWTEQTWNPTTGCTKITAGCKNCYAEVMHKRLTGMGQSKYSEPFTSVRTHEQELSHTFGKKPSLVFVNSMSDLFHIDVPLSFIQRVFAVIAANPHHIFQVLTKRAARLRALSPELDWPTNLWMGVSVEDERVDYRIDDLRLCGARVKWLSIEPLIGNLYHVDITGVDWVVVGGESGRSARPMNPDWVEDLLAFCESHSIPVFVKQTGIVLAKEWSLLDKKGGNMDEWPAWMQIRQFPEM